jgi:MFS family permease
VVSLPPGEPESAYAWTRLVVALLLATLGGVGLWSVVVALPVMQAEFGVGRADASLPFTLTMIGFGLGGIAMGRLSDRFGIVVPLVIGAIALTLGYAAAGFARSLWQLALVQALLIGAGSSTTFAPLMAHMSMWFNRRRGIAVAIVASGNYLAGTIWPPVLQHFFQTVGWRQTFFGVACICAFVMLPLTGLMRRPAPVAKPEPVGSPPKSGALHALGLSPWVLQTLLVIAGVSCCVAMSMPQVHMVAYCGDLGYGPARGAQMLSLMLGFGVVSRIAFGFICDRIGGLRTLLLGASLQVASLLLFIPFDSMVSLYVISILFGLSQGGIVPSYAIVVREFFSPAEAGTRIATVVLATLFGMALGGWMSGAIFDWTGSYRAAFVNGVLWNLVTVFIALWLLRRAMANANALSPRTSPC